SHPILSRGFGSHIFRARGFALSGSEALGLGRGTQLPETNRPQLGQTDPNCGQAGCLFDGYCALANSIFVGVNCHLPSTSLTVPVAVTFLDSLHSLPWNSLLTSLSTR